MLAVAGTHHDASWGRAVGSQVGVRIHGAVAPGFEAVAEAFEENFSGRRELGAAFAVSVDGDSVVDLWGGFADSATERPWQADTLVPIFSGTKGLVAICLLTLIERQALELEEPVCSYWPEFGKSHIRVRDIVSHTSRLPGIETQTSLADFLDDKRMAELLAEQQPSDDPRAVLHYHPFTYGWLCGELVRRVDGRSVGKFFAEEIAAPLDLNLWIGLPESEEPRVATLELADSWPAMPFLDRAMHENDSFLWSLWSNPPVMLKPEFPWNRRDYHAAEIPGAGAIGTARSVAQLYSSLDRVLGREILTLGRSTLSEGVFEPDGLPLRFGVGFQLYNERHLIGPDTEAFGHTGAGGSVHGCWPRQRIGFSYAMNLMRDDEGTDGRAKALLEALHEAIR